MKDKNTQIIIIKIKGRISTEPLQLDTTKIRLNSKSNNYKVNKRSITRY